MNEWIFAEKKQDIHSHGSWKVLIVDDDPGIHTITRTVLRDIIYENRSLNLISAFSRTEAESLLDEHGDIAVILLDVVMEEDDSGLRVVRYVRDEKKNPLPRIVLRTGQPGKAPPQKVIVEYDINEYEEKTGLTAQRLYTTVIASLRNYRDLVSLDANRTNLFRRRSGLTQISEASSTLFSARTPREFAQAVYDQMVSLFRDANQGSFFAALQDNSEFEVVFADGQFSNNKGVHPRKILGDTFLGQLRSLSKENRNLLVKEGTVSLYEDARKFRILFHMSGAGPLEAQNQQLLDIFASNVSIAFENLRLTHEIMGTQEDLIARLGEVVETRSHDTAQHVRRVSEYCVILAEENGMTEGEIHELRLASALHDIGKIGIPDDILLKPTILTDDEFSMVKTHTKIGHSLLSKSQKPLLKAASVISLQHHERYDGAGYPHGLSGDEIHIYARIVAICDVFDSLTQGRIHHDPWPLEQGMEYLEKEKGKSFDPTLVDLFISAKDRIVQITEIYHD